MTTAEGQDSGELARRTAMLGAIGYAATQIVAAADWRAGMQELLSRLGQATGGQPGDSVRGPSGPGRAAGRELPLRLGR